MKIRISASTLTALSAGLTALSAGALFAEAAPIPVIAFVRTERGLIEGQTTGGVDQFLGIPYAAPPVGELRWKAPVPAPPWAGVRDATQPGSVCIQPPPRSSKDSSPVGSEDCLYVNVYRPANTKARQLLPVIVFIHGGSNQRESASDYDPTEMVAKSGVIVVTLDYRLNVFGFLALSSLDAEAGDTSSGNFGLLDQQAAMRWVRDNILAFGGDPLNITVNGESSGGIDICAQLVSPGAAGLFHRAILESMYCPTATHDEALQVGAPVAVTAGCTDTQTAASCMRAMSAADVLQAAGKLSVEPGGGIGFNSSPNSGNAILPQPPLAALRAGQWNRAEILIGTNHDENALFVAPALLAQKVKLPLTADAYQQLVETRLGDKAPAVLAEYPADQYPNPFLALADLSTDPGPLGCAETPLAQLFSSLTTTYRYEFNDPTAPIPGAGSTAILSGLSMGAYHGSELQYLFKMNRLPGPKTPAQQALSAQMIKYWTNFAKTGDPNSSDLPAWPPYDANTHQLLSLRPTGSVAIDNFDTDHHCGFWASAVSQK